jgi:hypothetical protein
MSRKRWRCEGEKRPRPRSGSRIPTPPNIFSTTDYHRSRGCALPFSDVRGIEKSQQKTIHARIFAKSFIDGIIGGEMESPSTRGRVQINYFQPSHYWEVLVDGHCIYQGPEEECKSIRRELMIRMAVEYMKSVPGSWAAC